MYVGELVEVLKGEKSLSNGAQRKALYKSLSYLPIPERTVPSVHPHLITDKEEGFRTAVWLPVNVNGTPIELNLHFSVHKVCTCKYDRGRFDRPRPSPNKMAKTYQSMQACMPTNHALTRKYESIRQQALRRLKNLPRLKSSMYVA